MRTYEIAVTIENLEVVVLTVENQDEIGTSFENLFDLEVKDSWTVQADSISVVLNQRSTSDLTP